jgi:hypothetical protein
MRPRTGDPVPGESMRPDGPPRPPLKDRRYDPEAAFTAALARVRAPVAAAGVRSTAAAEMAPSTRTSR